MRQHRGGALHSEYLLLPDVAPALEDGGHCCVGTALS